MSSDSSPTKYYIASISNAKCLENTQKQLNLCRLRKWNKSAEQQWTLEAKEGQPQTFAFKSVIDNRYVAALEPDWRNGGKVGVSEEKQYWTLEPGRGPDTWIIKSEFVTSGGLNGYLNDEWGRMNDDNRIQTWQNQPGNPQYFNFYLRSVDAADAFDAAPAGKSSTSAKDQQETEQRAKEFEEKEAALAKREAGALQKAQDHEAALKKKEDELAQREQELAKASAAKTQNADWNTNDNVKSQELLKKEEALAKREADLAQREQELKSVSKSQPNGTSDTPAGTEDTAKLRARVAELERQLNGSSPQRGLLRRPIALASEGGVRPAGGIKAGWDPDLLKRFEIGRKAMSPRVV